MNPPRERLDTLLVRLGHFETRERAQASILAGQVFVAGRRVDKPGTRVAPGAAVEVRGAAIPYVGRGGLKLA
ncbi:MAG: TlyA family rRNA (cytidine-2'-O)-methyltransferase, partial [Armatimonadetes bacterium]|nr:TlyA family rRNA (cytidine-2'-O)-methyltransferase [Armatimonadota bacterium]